jgi:hypothetical protein
MLGTNGSFLMKKLHDHEFHWMLAIAHSIELNQWLSR